MNRSKAFWGALVLTICTTTGTPDAQEQRLDIPQARAVAVKLMRDGQPVAAKSIATALLERDPNDVAALLVLSRSERLLSNYKAAKTSGKKAWREAGKPEEKYYAAILTAQATAAGGNSIGSQIWLRRAAQVAPNERLKAQAVRDLRFVRTTTPLSVNLSFSLSPSSNVNNGSKSDRLTLGGLSFLLSGDARALSGLETRIGARIGYRLPVSERQDYFAEFNVDTRSYTLSSSAKAIAPNASGSDYNFQEVDLTFGTRITSKDSKRSTTLAVTFGKNWFGGDALTEFARLTANQRFVLDKTSSLDLAVSAEQQWRQDNSFRDALAVTTAATWTKRLNKGALLTLTGFYGDTSSDSAYVASDTLGAQVKYALGKPIFGKTSLELSLAYQKRNFDLALPLFGTREDRKTSASATMLFRDVEYYGFSPTLKVEASKNKSTISINETEDFGLSLGLRSTF